MEILFSKLSEPSLFLLIQVRKDPEGSVKIDLQSVKSVGFFVDISFCFIYFCFVFGCLFVCFIFLGLLLGRLYWMHCMLS